LLRPRTWPGGLEREIRSPGQSLGARREVSLFRERKSQRDPRNFGIHQAHRRRGKRSSSRSRGLRFIGRGARPNLQHRDERKSPILRDPRRNLHPPHFSGSGPKCGHTIDATRAAVAQKGRLKETEMANPQAVEMKLEVVVIPVADVDRAKDFYTGLG